MKFVANQANQPNFQSLLYSYERTSTRTIEIPSKTYKICKLQGQVQKTMRKSSYIKRSVISTFISSRRAS